MEEFYGRCKHVDPTGAPGPCSQFLVESELFIYVCYFVCIILVNLCCVCLFSMSGRCPWITFRWFSLESWFHWLLFQDKTYVQICSFGNTSLSPYLPLGQYQSASILATRAIPVHVHTCMIGNIFDETNFQTLIITRLMSYRCVFIRFRNVCSVSPTYISVHTKYTQ